MKLYSSLRVAIGFGLFALSHNLQGQKAAVKWLDTASPAAAQGVSWGTPWPQGLLKKDAPLKLSDVSGKDFPLETWPAAYWPDGSVKWTGHAIAAFPGMPASLTISPGAPLPPESPLKTTPHDDFIEVINGKTVTRLSRKGAFLVQSIQVENRVVAADGKLICILEDRSDDERGRVTREEEFASEISSATVEQAGSVRAVIKLEGRHKSPASGRLWLPFVVRLYFFAGIEEIKMVHTIIFDGDQEKDFIRGLGVRFVVPMTEEIQNRHVRFSGEGSGLWAEPIQPLKGRDGRFVANPAGGRDVYPDQINGKRVPNKSQVNARGKNLLEKWAVWDDFRLIQPNADGFTIEKRTNPKSAWLPAGSGKQASGLVYAGDVSGGLSVGLKNFWQSYPSSLEVRKASGDHPELIVWLWSPDAPCMDLRHYDIKAHGLDEVYEDVQPGFSSALGVARTSELCLFPSAGAPAKLETAAMAEAARQPALLVCSPQYLHDAKVFGLWSVQDRSTPFKKSIEDSLDSTLNYYLKEASQRNWHGFWDFGDIMHSYDNDRHVWRYDLGGMAWDNSELGTDMWLWCSFLRSGRADLFRMAEAMTRHTGEVDCYHLGPFAGLGSRHNVRHWGCGAKEARISQAAYRRFYYFLTTDERVGDLMRETLLSDYKAAEYDPMRLASPPAETEKKYPGRVRLGPDWLAFAGNWMTEWERTGDTKWRDKIMAGVESLAAMPLGIRNGKNLVMGYDPKSGALFPLSEEAGTYNLATIMGGGEVGMELSQLLNDAKWDKLWMQYCRLYSAPKPILLKDNETGAEGENANFTRGGRLDAYVYFKTKNKAFGNRALSILRAGRGANNLREVKGPESLNTILEIPGMGSNGAAQTGLETIEILEMCADLLPLQPQAGGPRGGRAPP